MIPDDFDTAYALRGAERTIADAKGRRSLRDEEEQMGRQVAYAVMIGQGLADARSWSIRAALLRDAQPTYAEFLARDAPDRDA